jgi:hypothetical protein
MGIVAKKQTREDERMVYSRILRRVALVRTDVSKERSVSFIRVTRTRELGTSISSQRASVASYS